MLDGGTQVASEKPVSEGTTPYVPVLLCTSVVQGKRCGAIICRAHSLGAVTLEFLCPKCREVSAFQWTEAGIVRVKPTMSRDQVMQSWRR